MRKSGRKSFYKNIRAVLCKKPLEKNKYLRSEIFLKIGHLAKAIAHAKALQNGHFKSKIKNAKNMRKTILQEQKSCSVQKTAKKKNRNIREMRGF